MFQDFFKFADKHSAFGRPPSHQFSIRTEARVEGGGEVVNAQRDPPGRILRPEKGEAERVLWLR